MPEALFTSLTRHRPVNFKTVDDLASAFRISRTATAFRLVEIGGTDCVLVCHGPRGRNWFVGSRRVEGHFWPLQQLSEHSDAFAILMRGEEGSGRSQLVDADDWINHPAAARFRINEHSVRAGPVVLTLLWWKDTTMVEELVH